MSPASDSTNHRSTPLAPTDLSSASSLGTCQWLRKPSNTTISDALYPIPDILIVTQDPPSQVEGNTYEYLRWLVTNVMLESNLGSTITDPRTGIQNSQDSIPLRISVAEVSYINLQYGFSGIGVVNSNPHDQDLRAVRRLQHVKSVFFGSVGQRV